MSADIQQSASSRQAASRLHSLTHSLTHSLSARNRSRFLRSAVAACFGLLNVALLTACGQGGGGSSGTSPGTPPGTPPPVSANLAPEIISAPVLFALPNSPYTYEAFAVDPNGDSVAYSLASAPQGMTINASTGQITWTPTSQQSGAHTVQVAASDGQLTGAQSFTATVEKHTTLASTTIGSEGGTVTVPQGTSEFAGASVTIPADQVQSGTTVTLSEVSQPSFAPSTVKALHVSIGSSGSASQTAGLLSKFSLTASAEAALPDPVSTLVCINKKIYLEILLPELAEFFAPGTKVWVKPATQAAGIPKDWQKITESIQLQKIGNIDAALSNAGGLLVCTAVGEGIEIMVEKLGEKIGGLLGEKVEGFLGTIFQRPRFDVIKGNENEAFWSQLGRNKLLFLHGILSSKEGFDGPDDWNAFAGSLEQYDDVLFYNYPSGDPIAGNGNQLCTLIRQMEKRFGTKLENIDIIAHSMGGLVARWLMEKSECRAEVLGRTLVKTLVMVGTPNVGISDVQLSNLLVEYGSKLADFVLPGVFSQANGAQDLLTSSQVIAELTRSVINKDKVPTRYVMIAGDVGTNKCGLFFEAPGTDCFVPVPTTALIKLLGIRDDEQGEDWEILPGERELYGHFALHTACTKNVVCARILKVLGGSPLQGDSPAPPTTNPPGAPGVVQQFAATSNAEPISTVMLNWIPPQGATEGLAYRIFRDGRLVDRVTTTSFKDTGLTPGREYVYTIQAEDQSGRRSTPIEVRVKTPGFVDSTAPNIATVPYHVNVTSSSTTIRWPTDEPADSQVEYGLTSALGSTSPLNAIRTRSHIVTLTGLSPDTTYSYRVKSRDAARNLATSSVKTFKTSRIVGGQPPPPPGPTPPPPSPPGGPVTVTVNKTGAGSGTVTSNPTGINCGATCAGSFASGTAVTLTPTPATGSAFAGWQFEPSSFLGGILCSLTAPVFPGDGRCTFTLDRNVTATARFEPGVTLTVTIAGPGSGNTAGCTAICSFSVPTGRAVSLSARTTGGSTFAGWSGGGCSGTGDCTLTMTTAQAVTATFNFVPPTVTITKAGAGSGTVTSNPTGINCGATCAGSFASGTAVTLTPTPATGSASAGWQFEPSSFLGGILCSLTAPVFPGDGRCTFTLDRNVTATARFEPAGGGGGTGPNLPGPLTLTAEAPVCDLATPVGPAVRLNWSASSNATSYEVYRNGALIPASANNTTLTFYHSVGLTAGQTYTYKVVARNADGTIDSNTITVSIPSNICVGSLLEPYQYQAFDGSTVTLYAMTGRETALLVPSPDLDVSTLNRIVAAFDGIYGAYRAATGRTPSLNVNYHGLSTVVVVPSTCGAGCAYLGFTGIELSTQYFNVLYEGMRDRNQFDQVVAYEFGRNFWFYSDQLSYKAQNEPVVSGFAVFMRFISMDRAGLAGGPFNGSPFSSFRAEVEGLVDRYLADPSKNWGNTLGVNQGVPNPMNLQATDLFASFVYKLTRRYGDDFVNRLWQQAGLRPSAVTTQDAVDNFILAACAASSTNLTAVFEQTWRWPVSADAKQQAGQYGPASPTL